MIPTLDKIKVIISGDTDQPAQTNAGTTDSLEELSVRCPTLTREQVGTVARPEQI